MSRQIPEKRARCDKANMRGFGPNNELQQAKDHKLKERNAPRQRDETAGHGPRRGKDEGDEKRGREPSKPKPIEIEKPNRARAVRLEKVAIGDFHARACGTESGLRRVKKADFPSSIFTRKNLRRHHAKKTEINARRPRQNEDDECDDKDRHEPNHAR